MSNIIQDLSKKGLIVPPVFVKEQSQYVVQMGSVAYGVAGESSDWDIYGFCIPTKEMIFPHLAGEIEGFGKQKQRFESWQKHHVEDSETKKIYDFLIFGIVKYFSLLMDNNPNVIDSLYVPRRCVLHSSRVGEIVRDNKKIFLSKASFHRFKGYAYSQLSKMSGGEAKEMIELENKLGFNQNSTNEEIEKSIKYLEDNYVRMVEEQGRIKSLTRLLKLRKKVGEGRRITSIRENNYDKKFAYHIVRLLEEAKQILEEGDLDLEKSKEILKSIRRGEWTEEQIKSYFNEHEKILDELYKTSKLQYSCNEEQIKSVLLKCLEEHFGSMDKCIVLPQKYLKGLRDIKTIIEELGV